MKMMNRKLKKYYKILDQVKHEMKKMEAKSDEELANMTVIFKERLANGESLDSLLPEAFAVVCEADYRVLGMKPYDVQIIGGIALHFGNLAEMKTGEGKTLVATMPLYLNALTGKGTFLLTSNEYLVLRDAEEMGQVYKFLGLTIAAGVGRKEKDRFTNDQKKKIYASDIVYTTHGALGFDYLFNNLVTSAEDRFMRPFYYVIIDEADSVLLDAAQTPLVISGSPRVQSNLYELTDFFVTTLVENEDYEKEDKMVWLTEKGIKYAESFFGVDNLYSEENFEINRHIVLALRAHKIFKKEKDYMVSNANELVLLDGGSGRMMQGVKMRGGQHQALEVKEGVKLSQETRSMASVTYQNLFKMFPKLAGMSGTIYDAAEELRDTYQIDSVIIPTNSPIRRKDLPDIYFKDAATQISEAISEALRVHATGQPVLIVVSTIFETEWVSKLLLEENIPHNVLNAFNAFWEADIIKEAGHINAVTVATSMAGRGTDIKLSKEVKDLGGLAVIGIGRMDNIRQERQARGRSGRQGDPGFSRFYVALSDEVVKKNGPKNIDKYIEGKKRISKRKIKRLVDGAQRLGEEQSVLSRRNSMDFDQVLQKQREIMYATRDYLLDGEVISEKKIKDIARNNIREFIEESSDLNIQDINRYILDNISYHVSEDEIKSKLQSKRSAENYLVLVVAEALREQKKRVGSEKKFQEFMRKSTLQALDEAWIEQVDYLQQLASAVAGRSTAQRNPIHEYQFDGLESYDKMKKQILRNTVRNILLSSVSVSGDGELSVIMP